MTEPNNPAEKPSQEELRQRVSGQTRRPPPPPVGASAQVTAADAPLPQRPRLTPGERTRLMGLGWRDGDPLPVGLPEALEQAMADNGGKDIPPEEFRELCRRLATSEQMSRDLGENNIRPDMKAHFDAAKAAAAQQSQDLFDVVNDLPTAGGSAAKDEPTTATEPHTHTPDQTGAAGPAVCPFCNFDLKGEVPEPSDADKTAFIEATFLGGIPFAKQYNLLGGRLVVRFRTLRRRELDEIYAYVGELAQKDPTITNFALAERVQQCRMNLQLLMIVSGAHEIPCPEGLDAITAPTAKLTWLKRLFNDSPAASPGTPAYRAALFEGIANVQTMGPLEQEVTLSIVFNAFTKFSRLVARLEMMADASDFWPPIGSPSA